MAKLRSLVVVICILHLVQCSMVNEVGIEMPESERSIGRTITSTVSCNGDSTGGWGSRGTLKRSRKETLATDSCSPSVEALNLGYVADRDRKNSRIKIGEAEKVRQCTFETISKFKSWAADFLSFQEDPAPKNHSEERLDSLVESVSNLFQQKITELEGQPAKLHSYGQDTHATSSVSMTETWLSSVADIDRVWESLNPREENAIDVMKNGVTLMIDFFIDVQRLEIISKEDLYNFLNQKNQGKLISSYAINGFPRFPSTIADVYMNFNVRLSLQEGPATKKMRKLLQVNRFSKLKKEFLTVASPENSERSPAGLDLFLYEWVKCATAPRWLRPAEPTDKELIEYKRLDDMFRYVIHYHKHHLTVNCLEGMKSHALEVHALEEGVNLLSSVYQLLYWRRDQVYTHLSHRPQQPDFLMDSNGYRKITRFRGAQRSPKFEEDFGEASSQEEPQNLSLHERLEDATSQVQASIRKVKYQLKRYLRKFKSLEPDGRKQSYYNLIDHFSILSETLLKEKDHEFAELYSSKVKSVNSSIR
ncbi:hypothetical protein Pst134EA_017597 [Puccinia striiformis f. sp. tritici]|uniref:hypothetical protein n=1 Tax=Puccinia striiformis f. sp. tritici TaxID=168172 RepID=UPI002007740D|nr:hypothetical protein Pst134EA_017597 [Puccinia striiformis f. sp. tritici]KAH9461290.1 hypothetical protein Pst134EA_017597 [Puccinia striiformis f. sp. tritici]